MKSMQLRDERAFKAIMRGRLVSNIGSSTTRFAVIFWTLASGGSPAEYSLVLVAGFLPMGLGALIAGPAVDRWDRRRVMLISNSAVSIFPLAAAVLYFTGQLEIWHLLIVLSADGIASAFMMPAFEASIPQLVRKEKLERASGIGQANVALATIVGSVLAGSLLAPVGLGALFALNFVTFAPVLVALKLSIVPSPSKEAKVGESGAAPSESGIMSALAQDFADGLRYLRQRRPLMRLLWIMTAVMLLLPGFEFALCTPLVMTFADEQAAGFVLASFGLGALVGGVLLAVWTGPEKRMNGILVALGATGLAAVAVVIRENLTVMLVGIGFIGMGFTFLMGLSRVVWQVKVTPIFLGRVLSLRQLFGLAAQSVGLLVAAPIAAEIFEPILAADGALAGSAGLVFGVGPGRGTALMFALVGAAAFGLALACILAPRIRRLEDLVPDVDQYEGIKR